MELHDTLLEVSDIECRYHGRAVVQAFSISVPEYGIVCLLGPSGCGKTTVLRAIAGFEPIYTGRIVLRGRQLSVPGRTVPPERRSVGMVFQDYALFPHMTVAENITFGLRRRSRRERQRIAMEMLELVGLEELERRYPHELSGGQQQRVALARTLAPGPELILLDEPFSNLDIDLRERLSREVHEILKHRGITGILVTHDQHEAFAMGEQVGVMMDGCVVQWDTPYNLYHEPRNRFVADFIGQGCFLPGRLTAPDTVDTDAGVIKGKRAFLWPTGTEVDVLLRPDDVVPDSGHNLRGQVVQKAFKGAEILYTLRLKSGTLLLSLFPSHLNHDIGDYVGIRIAAKHVVAFRRDSHSAATASQDGRRINE